MGRLNELAGLKHELLQNVSRSMLPITVHRRVLRAGPKWMDNCTNLLPFLRDAREVDGPLVDIFLNHVQSIQRMLQKLVGHVRRSQSELEKLLPKVSTALSLWTYKLKSTFSAVHDDGAALRVGGVRDRFSQDS
jgi:hypothetical protein